MQIRMTEYQVPDPESGPYGITVCANGRIWFTEQKGNRIGMLTESGDITEYTIPTESAGASIITSGIGGELWFTEYKAGKIGKITP